MRINRTNQLFLTLLFLLLPALTYTQIIGTSAYMIGDNVEIGINDAGHEGAPLLGTSNNRSNQAPGSPVYFGFVANPQLDGWVNYDGDFFTPGSPENGFGLEIAGINYHNNASGTLENIPGSISSYEVDGDCMSVVWDGTIGDIDVHIVYRLITTELYYTTEVTLTNTGVSDYTDIYYYRNLDPDNNVTIGGGYSTQNTIVAQPEPDCEKALVTATQTGPWDSYIGLGAIGTDFRVTYGGFANRDASDIWNGFAGLTSAVGSTAFADQAISLAYRVSSLPAGESETFLFTIVLDEAYIDAAISSLYYFDYVGGGGVIDECSPIVDTAQTCAGMPITISVDGPNADDYTWTWAPPVGLSTTDGPTTDASPAVTTEYTVTGEPAPLCLSSTIEKTIVVEIVPSPIIDITDPGPQCEEFDLTTLVVTDLGGIDSPIIEFFSVYPDSVDQTTGIWPSDFMYPGDVVYVMLGDTSLGCFDVDSLEIDFATTPNAGLDNTDELCNSPGTTLDLNTLLSGADAGGTWEELTGSGAFNPLTGVFDASGLASGDYTFIYIAENIPCPEDTAEFVITVLPNPTIDAGSDVEVCAGDPVTLTGTGAGVGGTYTWTGGITDGVPFTPVATITYTVTGTNAEGCQNTDDVTVTVNPLPIIDAGADDAICDGDMVTLTGTGAGVGGTYTWDGGVTDGVPFSPGATATYTVTGTDANGCINTDDITITVNPLPIIDAGVDDAICDGDMITLTGTGAGVGGTYTWTGGVTDGVPFSPAATATYTVTGTDAEGCENTDDITITVNPLPVIDAGADDAICAGDMVTLTGSGAGVGGTYAWTGGVTDGVPFTPGATTTYTVTGTDANGCVSTDDITITVNPLPIIDAGLDHAICDGDMVTLTGAGAGVGGTYAWDGGVTDGVPFSPGATATYTVTGTDANGCVNTDDVTITVNPLPAVDAGPDFDVCEGGTITLAGTGAGVGGTYAWDMGVLDGVPFIPGATATYTVTGTDVNGCVNTDDVTVTVNDLLPVSAGPDFDVCIGDEATLTGTGAGVGGTYVWDMGVIDGTPFTPAGTADYIVTGTDVNGCVNTDTVTITVNPLPIIDAGLDHAICIGDETTLTGTGAGVGGTYAWDGGVTDGVPFSPAATATYTVTGTDANGCVNTDDITITVNPLPVIDAGADDAICDGDMVTLTGTGAGVGGTYTWDGGVTDGVPFSPAATATYTVTGTDANGCINTDDITITVNPLPVIDAGADDAICAGDMVTLTGSGAGVGGTYAWTGGVTDGVPFTPGATTTYTVTGTDANGCVSTDDITITVNPLPVIDAGADDAICDGDMVTLTGAGAGVGGTYAWDGGVTDGVPFSPGATATYTVTGTDANGCVNTDDVTITVNPLPAVDAGPDFDVCEGGTITLAGTGAGVGGTYAWDMGVLDGVPFIPGATATYTVTGTDVNGCVNTDDVTVTVNDLLPVSAGPDFDVCIGDEATLTGSGAGIGGTYVWDMGVIDGTPFTPAGTADYIVTGTDVNGCVNTDTVTITVNPLPIIDAGLDHAICIGDETTLTGTGAGVGGTYAWDGGVTDGVAFSPAATTSFIVTGTDVNGCENTDDIVVTVNPLPVIDAGLDHAICIGDETTLTGSGAGVGGTYVWDGGVMDGIAFSPGATETYTVTGTDANGCVNTDDITVTVNELPAVEAGVDETMCIGDWVTLEGSGAGPGATYLWDGGGIDGVAFSPGATDMYTVTGTDTDGCVNIDSVMVYVNPLPDVDAGPDVAVCEGGTVVLGGTGAGVGATYEWDGGGVDGVPFEPGATATYIVTGTDENGCVNTDSVIVTVNPLPVIDAGPDNLICIGESITLTGSGAGVDGTYIWTGGVEDGVPFSPGVTDDYTVIGTDINGCENFDMVTITVVDLPPVDAGLDQEICIGESVTLNGSGAGVGGTYTWDGGVTDGIEFSPGSTTTYTVTGTTTGGCSSTDEVTVIVHPLPDIAFTADELQGCAPFTTNFTSLNPGITFEWEFGDGSIGSGAAPSHTYISSGVYDVTLTVTSSEGCVATEVYSSFIDVAPAPIAAFSYSPYDITINNTEVDFENESMYADTYTWEFGDGSPTSNLENPTHDFPVIGNVEYWVTLTAHSDYGCEDTTRQLIQIKDELIYHVPNTFTPDGDSFNDSFKPIFLSGVDIYDYHLMIFNRWGEMVFESYNEDYGWDGSYGDMGLVEDGVYIWRMEFGETMSDKKHYVNGHITVLK